MDNNFNAFYQAPPAPNAEQPKKHEYSKIDAIIALLLFPLSYFITSIGIWASLNRVISFVFLFILTLVYLKKSGVKLMKNKMSLILGFMLLALNIGIFFTDNMMIKLTVLGITVILFPYFVFSLSDNSSEKIPASLFFLELIKSTFVMPFGSLLSSFEAISQNKMSGKIGKKLLTVFLGLAIAFIPCLIVIFLLSYDESFNGMLDKFLDFSILDMPNIIKNIILALPISLLLFGTLYSGKSKRFDSILDKEKCQKAQSAMEFAPALLCASVVIPFILVYILFFISQRSYYLSAFSGVLPEGLTYAYYAKSGFFQLCAVALINFVIIICISIFAKKKNGETHLALRIINSVFSLATLILIATAFSKMVIYIEAYGLTLLRVLPSAFMVFLSIVFIMILIKQFAKKANVVIVSLFAAILICGALAFADVDNVIAKYNTDRFLAGELEHFDINMLSGLGNSGAVQLDRIYKEADDPKIQKAAKELISAMPEDFDSNDISLPEIRKNSTLRQ